MIRSTCARALFLGAFVLGGVRIAAASGDIVLHARSASAKAGVWSHVSDASAADGVRLASANAGVPKLSTPLASPANYFEMTFTAEAGRAYHLWIRGKALNDAWTNDSVFVQFSGSVTSSGAAQYRIGTTSAMVYSLEEDSGMGESGWGWQDNGWGLGTLGDNIYFTAGQQRIRVQTREDGLSIDQIVLSPVTYISRAPGAGKNDTTILAEAAGADTGSTSPPPSGFTWTLPTKATVSGGTLKKTGTCTDCPDAGGVGLPAMTSGSVTFTVAGGRLAVGLGRDTSASTDYTKIDYAFSFGSSGTYSIRERGIYKAEGGYSTSDQFKVAIEGTTVRYYRNGSVVYTSTTPVSSALVVDATLVTTGATVTVAGATTTAPAPAPAPAPSPAPAPTGSTLKVLQWNLHHGGFGTDGVYDTNRVATWIAKMNPDVIMLNEIEKYTFWGNQDQSEVYKSLLQQKTGKTWYYMDAQEFGQWSSNGKRNVIFSTVPFNYRDRYELVHYYDRSIAEGEITWNGRRITLMVTHLDPYSQSIRLSQATEVTSWAAAEPEDKILAGDMNAWPDQSSIYQLNKYFYDSWTVAASKGTATAFPGNTGETKNGRIDYIFYSKGASNLVVRSSQVIDTRDSRGVMPSDHRPVLTTFEVR